MCNRRQTNGISTDLSLTYVSSKPDWSSKPSWQGGCHKPVVTGSYQMNFAQAISSVFKQYIVFSGRACRSEYWWFILFAVIVVVILPFISRFLWGIFILALIVPSLSVFVRRLHDTGKSAWWLLLQFVPFGGFVLLVFAVTRGDVGDNRFGPDPLLSPEDISATGMVIGDVGEGQGPPGEARHCANCGSSLASAANFCRSCGTAV